MYCPRMHLLFLLQPSLTVTAGGPLVLADSLLSPFLPGAGNLLTQIQEAADLV